MLFRAIIYLNDEHRIHKRYSQKNGVLYQIDVVENHKRMESYA